MVDSVEVIHYIGALYYHILYTASLHLKNSRSKTVLSSIISGQSRSNSLHWWLVKNCPLALVISVGGKINPSLETIQETT